MSLKELFFWKAVKTKEQATECEKIADDFAIGFADWCDNLSINQWSDKTTKELLQIYKEEYYKN